MRGLNLKCLKKVLLSALIMFSLNGVTEAAEPIPEILQGELYSGYNKHVLMMRNTPFNFFGEDVVSCKRYYSPYNGLLSNCIITTKSPKGQKQYVVTICPVGIAVGDIATDTIYLAHKEKIHEFKTGESIGGLAPYMFLYQVAQTYGKPANVSSEYKITRQNNRPPDFPPYEITARETWKYDREGFAIEFLNGGLLKITIYPNSAKRFDKTGLGVNSNIYDVCRALGLKKGAYQDVMLNDYVENDVRYEGTTIFFYDGKLNYVVANRY